MPFVNYFLHKIILFTDFISQQTTSQLLYSFIKETVPPVTPFVSLREIACPFGNNLLHSNHKSGISLPLPQNREAAFLHRFLPSVPVHFYYSFCQHKAFSGILVHQSLFNAGYETLFFITNTAGQLAALSSFAWMRSLTISPISFVFNPWYSS